MYEDEAVGACVVVVEHGAEWFGTATERSMDDVRGRVMVVQQPGESPAELTLRVRRRALSLTQSKTPVTVAVMAVSDSSDEATFEARCQIARCLLQVMNGGVPNLVLSAPPNMPDAGRHELLAIAGTLTGQLYGSPVEVSVRFPTAPARLANTASGLHRIAPSLEVA